MSVNLKESSRSPGKAGARLPSAVECDVSDVWDDPAWDDFLLRTPGSHHAQSSLWGQVKSVMGCQSVRVVARRGGEIVGGGQMLIRRLFRVGKVAYLPKGPTIAGEDREVARLALDALKQAATERGVHLLVVQPADRAEAAEEQMAAAGFAPSRVAISPTATCVLDLSKSLDELLAGMKLGTRYNVRLAQRKGIVAREGDESDLPAYCAMLAATGARQGFRVYPESYYRAMWRAFYDRGLIRLSLAEYQGELVSGQIAIHFGDTASNKMSVWSGRWGKFRPNEMLQWHSIQQAKHAGCRWYDFDGIKTEAAEAALRGEPLPEHFQQTVSSFKLGFGSQALLVPGAFDYVPSRPLRWIYRSAGATLIRSDRLREMAYWLRTRGAKAPSAASR